MPCDRPRHRGDFRIAIICALTVEYDAVSLVFDRFWDENDDTFGRAHGDTNTYTTGRIGKHDVVLVLASEHRHGCVMAGGNASPVELFRPGDRLP